MSDREKVESQRLFNEYGHAERYKHTHLDFLDYSFELTDTLSFLYQFKEIFAEGIYDFPCRSKEPVIYDCGANVGLSALYFKLRHPSARVTAFEADPTVAQALEHNMLANGQSDVEVVAKAVWIDDAGVDFAQEGADGGSIHGQWAKRRIPSIRLRDMLIRESHVDFLKLDIEGSEAQVLEDCQDVLDRVGSLFVECHGWRDAPQNLHSILTVLHKAGFRYYLENNWPRTEPYGEGGGNPTMDLQVNVWARRPD